MALSLAIAYLVCFAVVLAIAVSEPGDRWLHKLASFGCGVAAIALAITTVVA